MTEPQSPTPEPLKLRARRSLSLTRRLALLETDAAAGGELLGEPCVDCGERALRVRFWGRNQFAGIPVITVCDVCEVIAPSAQFVERMKALGELEVLEDFD